MGGIWKEGKRGRACQKDSVPFHSQTGFLWTHREKSVAPFNLSCSTFGIMNICSHLLMCGF